MSELVTMSGSSILWGSTLSVACNAYKTNFNARPLRCKSGPRSSLDYSSKSVAMKVQTLISALSFSGAALAGLPPQVARLRGVPGSSGQASHERLLKSRMESILPRAATATPKASEFLVNSSSLPLVTFPLQNSYAGRLPISSNKNETRVS